jgi:hypothetical protein
MATRRTNRAALRNSPMRVRRGPTVILERERLPCDHRGRERAIGASRTFEHLRSHRCGVEAVRSDWGRPRRLHTGYPASLLAGYQITNPETGFPVLAFRLHQFISRGDSVFATFEPEYDRFLTVRGQKFEPGDRGKVLLPIVFCRGCGQEYYLVREYMDPATGSRKRPTRGGPRNL